MTRLTNNQAREAIHATQEFTTNNGTVRGRRDLAGTGIMRNPA